MDRIPFNLLSDSETYLPVAALVIFPNATALRFTAITFYLVAVFLGIICCDEIGSGLRRVFQAYLLSLIPVLTALPWRETLQIGDRFMGWFKDPNVMAAYLVPGILYALVALASAETRRPAIPWALLAGCLALMFSWTVSRGALVSLVSALVAFLPMSWRMRRHFGLTLLSGLLVVGIASGIWLEPLVSVLQHEAVREVHLDAVAPETREPDAGPQPSSVLHRFAGGDPGRINNYRAGLQVAIHHPLGVGPGNYEQHAIEFRIADEPFAMAAHSLYLRTLVETGVLGFVSFMIFLAGMGRQLANRIRMCPDDCLPLFLMASLFAVLVHSLLIDSLHWRHFWVLLGLVAVVCSAHRFPSAAANR